MAGTPSDNVHKSESDIQFNEEGAKTEEERGAGLKSYAVRLALKPKQHAS
jgi:hypothetical protein